MKSTDFPVAPLSGDVLYNDVREIFKTIADYRDPIYVKIPIEDFFMSGLALFALKFPSLLKFDEELRSDTGISRLGGLFQIAEVPSDTRMREVLDLFAPEVLRPAFKFLFEKVQKTKTLKQFEVWDNTYCLAVDGTGSFYSDSVKCTNCLEKTHKSNDEKSYYHQELVGVFVHPDQKQVIPLYPTAIQKQDGNNKNDCERSAIKRFLEDFRREHPKLRVLLLADALHATQPIIKLLRLYQMNFILAAKPGSHEKLFDSLDQLESQGRLHHIEKVETIGDKVKKERTRHYRFTHGVLLNHQDLDVSVNFIEFWETIQWVGKGGTLKEEKIHMSWITDQTLHESNIEFFVRVARTRWHIENETFNTLKNQGYEFEHNFGHGKQNLHAILVNLMFLAYLIDQLQEMKCPLFQKAIEKVFFRKSRLWEKLKVLFEFFPLKYHSWRDFLEFFVNPHLKIKETDSG